MITPQLADFIRVQLAAGVPQGAIRQSLVGSGWTEQDIAEAFAATAPKAAIATVAQPSLFGRKLTLSLGLLFASLVYAAWQNVGSGRSAVQSQLAGTTPSQSLKAANDALLQTLAQIESSAPAAAPSPAGTAQSALPAKTPATATAPAPKPTGQYADGSYTGTPADAYYGTVQVKAVIRNGHIADVQFLQYPSDRANSQYINSVAMPLLTQEAIQVQSAQVDGVSGATFTSQAFQQSLASALTQAKI